MPAITHQMSSSPENPDECDSLCYSSFPAVELEKTTLTPSSHPVHLLKAQSTSEVKIRADYFSLIV